MHCCVVTDVGVVVSAIITKRYTGTAEDFAEQQRAQRHERAPYGVLPTETGSSLGVPAKSVGAKVSKNNASPKREDKHRGADGEGFESVFQRGSSRSSDTTFRGSSCSSESRSGSSDAFMGKDRSSGSYVSTTSCASTSAFKSSADSGDSWSGKAAQGRSTLSLDHTGEHGSNPTALTTSTGKEPCPRDPSGKAQGGKSTSGSGRSNPAAPDSNVEEGVGANRDGVAATELEPHQPDSNARADYWEKDGHGDRPSRRASLLRRGASGGEVVMNSVLKVRGQGRMRQTSATDSPVRPEKKEREASRVRRAVAEENVQYCVRTALLPEVELVVDQLDLVPFGFLGPSEVLAVRGRHTNKGIVVDITADGNLIILPYPNARRAPLSVDPHSTVQSHLSLCSRGPSFQPHVASALSAADVRRGVPKEATPSLPSLRSGQGQGRADVLPPVEASFAPPEARNFPGVMLGESLLDAAARGPKHPFISAAAQGMMGSESLDSSKLAVRGPPIHGDHSRPPVLPWESTLPLAAPLALYGGAVADPTPALHWGVTASDADAGIASYHAWEQALLMRDDSARTADPWHAMGRGRRSSRASMSNTVPVASADADGYGWGPSSLPSPSNQLRPQSPSRQAHSRLPSTRRGHLSDTRSRPVAEVQNGTAPFDSVGRGPFAVSFHAPAAAVRRPEPTVGSVNRSLDVGFSRADGVAPLEVHSLRDVTLAPMLSSSRPLKELFAKDAAGGGVESLMDGTSQPSLGMASISRGMGSSSTLSPSAQAFHEARSEAGKTAGVAGQWGMGSGRDESHTLFPHGPHRPAFVPPLKVGSTVLARRFGNAAWLEVGVVKTASYDCTYTLQYVSDGGTDRDVLHNDVYLISERQAEDCTVRDRVVVALHKHYPAVIVEACGNKTYRVLLHSSARGRPASKARSGFESEANSSRSVVVDRRHIVFVVPLLKDALYAPPDLVQQFRRMDYNGEGLVSWSDVRHWILSWEHYGCPITFERLGEIQRDLSISERRRDPHLMRRVPIQHDAMQLTFSKFEFVVRRAQNTM